MYDKKYNYPTSTYSFCQGYNYPTPKKIVFCIINNLEFENCANQAIVEGFDIFYELQIYEILTFI